MSRLFKIGASALALVASISYAHAEPLIGLAAGNKIVTFDSTSPTVTTSTRTVSGLPEGAVLTGLDVRPADRKLYTVSTTGSLFRLDKVGANFNATLVGNLRTAATLTSPSTPVAITGNRFGLDFNPVPDRLRLVSDFDRNLRINPNDGITIIDGTIAAPGAEALVGAAYTNNRAGATSTVLYALDAAGNKLLRSTNANAGTYVDTNLVDATFGPLGVDLGGLNNVGFDISGKTGAAFFATTNQLYSLNLTSGSSTLIGDIGGGALTGLTAGAVPEPETWALMIVGFGAVGAAMRVRTRRRLLSA